LPPATAPFTVAAPADLVEEKWIATPGDSLRSHNPANPAETVWQGAPVPAHVDRAVAAARKALTVWSSWPIEKRIAGLRAVQALMRARVEEIARLIVRETGKAAWDSLAEAKLLADKIDITLEIGANTGMARVSGFDLALSPTRTGSTRFRPHGVMAVVGPFNFPAHLPNGHIVPALAMGNTVVFKPSDKAPAVGQLLATLFHEGLSSVGAPAGVVNMVQGAASIASALVTHDGIDGVLFTGSWPVGRRILEANLDRPGRMIALEMGGNNAAVVMPDADLKQAVIECVRSAFVTTGQRCTCTRRIIVHEAASREFIPMFQRLASTLVVGSPDGVGGQPVFMGPIIRAEAVDSGLKFQSDLHRVGGRPLIESTAMESTEKGHYITPGAVLVDRFSLAADASRDAGCDLEVFAPIVRISVSGSFEDALMQANASRYGLAASIFTHDRAAIERFLLEAKAGCVNVNTGTAGASSKLPFGGLDRSGNHRPAGSFSLDYCAFPVASMVEMGLGATTPPGMGAV
jgi:succinylglutamic semialdehyde dehydrogenase